MNLKFLVLTPFLFLLMACNESGDGTTASPSVTGEDLSGSYTLIGYECYQASSPYSLTQYGQINASGSITINGNSYSSSTSDNDCVVEISSNIVFGTDNTYDISQSSVTSATSGSCDINATLTELNGSANSLVSRNVTISYSEGSLADSSNIYDYTETSNNNLLAIYFPLVTVSGSSPSDNCFLVYREN